MLKESILTNTWACDNCGLETVSELDPYFNATLYISALPLSPPCAMDLCQTCVQLIQIQGFIDYVASAKMFP